MRTTNGIAWVGLWPMGQAAASTRGPVPVRMWQGRAKSRFRCCRVRQVRRRMLWDPWGRLARHGREHASFFSSSTSSFASIFWCPVASNGRFINPMVWHGNSQSLATMHHVPCPMQPTWDTGSLSSESPPFPQTRVAATRRNGCELCRPLFGTLPAFSAHSPARPRNKVNLPSGSHVSPAESRSV